MNKLNIEIDRKGQLGFCDLRGNQHTLINFISQIIDQHPGVRRVIREAVMKSSLRLVIHRAVERELQKEATEVQEKLKRMINQKPGVN